MRVFGAVTLLFVERLEGLDAAHVGLRHNGLQLGHVRVQTSVVSASTAHCNENMTT